MLCTNREKAQGTKQGEGGGGVNVRELAGSLGHPSQ